MTSPSVVLVGPPGAGKSSVGVVLADMLQLPFRDVDQDIVAVQQRSISDIFTTDGEERFRELEREAVTSALAEHGGVLALGGGAVLDPSIRDLLRGQRVVFLSVSMPQGVQRTGMAANRPLLVGVNPRATFKALLDARVPLYREIAALEVDTDAVDVRQVATSIIQKLGLV